jgi:isoleucyl-tRNA synthetase
MFIKMYKDTLFLPKTSFSMRANLNELSPRIIKSWKIIKNDIVKKDPSKRKFLLHSGPPFANGRSHLGHALNFILKDALCRYKSMAGYDVSFYWGWDCHGLPIEIKVEQEYKEKGRDLTDLVAFRKSCRDSAAHWTEVQKEDLMKLGLMVNKDEAYSTMDYHSESSILDTIFEFVKRDVIYRDVKPVFWSIAEKTAFAEAEIQYVEDHVSTSCYVFFPLKSKLSEIDSDVSVIIWTTTPWTLPCNRAIAYSDSIDYVLASSESIGKKFLIAKNLVESLASALKVEDLKIIKDLKTSELEGLKCEHPLRKLGGYDFDIPVVLSDHVTDDVGTGFVHMAPSHGVEDFVACKKYGIPAFDSVAEDGSFTDLISLFSGKKIFDAIPEILDKIKECGNLLASHKIKHSYPYSWRSNTPLIFRTTPQWFIRFDDKLRDICLKGIDEVNWIPEQGKNRITAMIQNRPDWCISRQRLWGIPLFLFVDKKENKPLVDKEMMDIIVNYVRENGLDVCFTDDVWNFLPSQYNRNDFYIVKDVIDVWFESGATHKFVVHDILGEKTSRFLSRRI